MRPSTLDELVRDEQLQAHYAQVPAMAIAPTAGGFFTAWVLWNAVENLYLVVGMALVTGLSAVRLWLYARYTKLPRERRGDAHWHRLAVAAALVSGCVWGSAAPLLYPPQQPDYEVFVVVLLTLVPIIPVAALAAYMPAFYAYYLPCVAPFVVTLVLHRNRAEGQTALLLVMMTLAMLVFARRYSRNLAEAILLRMQLAQRSDALQAAIEHRTRFIASASHDLRQPVHAMGLFLETLSHGGDAQIGKAVAHLEASQRSLRNMLGNLLDISKLDAKVVTPQLRDFGLDELLRLLSEEFAPQARAKGLALRWRPCRCIVRSDPVLLERILRNLLANALKYTARGGVLLACRRTARGVSLGVYDTGIGIPPEQHEAIFQEFGRVPHAGRTDPDGLGLGLAIVRQTAGLLGHALRLRSVSGRGSVFTLELERAAAAALPAAGDVPPAVPLPPGLVLVVDDDDGVREGTAVLLERWGLRTWACASVAQALARMASGSRVPDVLLVDFRLAQGESGLRGVDAIRERAGRAIPAILVTGDTAPDRIRQAYEAGHFLLHKPVDPLRLRACIAEALLASQARADEDAARLTRG